MPPPADEAYSLGASAAAQSTLRSATARLDALLDARDAAVREALSDYAAYGVDDLYRDAEQRWFRASGHLRETISSLRGALAASDSTARDALARARADVSAVGA